jgi:hypothetical protein
MSEDLAPIRNAFSCGHDTDQSSYEVSIARLADVSAGSVADPHSVFIAAVNPYFLSSESRL